MVQCDCVLGGTIIDSDNCSPGEYFVCGLYVLLAGGSPYSCVGTSFMEAQLFLYLYIYTMYIVISWPIWTFSETQTGTVRLYYGWHSY